jgi:helicase
MAFKGLFIGIDRYDSPEINWLSCANRDAKALHASESGKPMTGET